MTKTITVSDEKDKSNKIQIKTFEGEVLFESERKTIKEAVEEAVSKNIRLVGADLSNTDLSNANLRNAELSVADFRNSDLSNADFSNADLECADFRGSDLRNANFSKADLIGAYLGKSNLSGADLQNTRFYGKGGITTIEENQINDFLTALGVVVEG